MFRYLLTLVLTLSLLPGGVQAASTVNWYAGPHGSISQVNDSGVTVTATPGSAPITETLTNWQRSLSVTATVDAGYQFRNYSGSNGFKSTSNPVTYTDDGQVHTDPISITANFTTTLNQYDLVVHGAPDAVEIQAGRTHTVVLNRNGTVTAWGGSDGQSDPEIATVTGVTAIGVGPYTTFLVTNGIVKGYGKFADNSGNTIYPVFVPDPAPANVIALASGLSHTAAIKSDGSVEVWGSANGSGQLNLPDFKGLKATALAAGHNFTLALMEDGSVIGWGQNDHGEISGIPSLTGTRKIVAISAKAWHAMALFNDGTVLCWGQNDWGQGTLPAGLANVKAIAAGGHHSVALQKDGTVVVWGGNPTNSGVPQGYVPPGTGGTALIGAGYYHSVAVTPIAILGWGANESKQCEAPARAYAAITNGNASCQTLSPYSPTVEYGFTSVCTIAPNTGMNTFYGLDGIQQAVASGATTTTIANIQSFHTVTVAFGTAPGAPGIASVSSGAGEATVMLTAPANNGGSPINGYEVATKTPVAGAGVDSDAWTTSLVHTVTGLNSGTSYTFTAAARNLLGTSGASDPSKQSQAITITTAAPASAAKGSTFTVAATAPGGAVSYGSAGGCTNVGATFTMTSASVACTVRYDQVGSDTYATAPELSSVTLATKADQGITVSQAAPASAQFGTSFTVTATAPGGEVSYTSAGGCSNVGATFTMTSSTLACTVKYDQSGSTDYNQAPEVTSQTSAAKADQVITVTAGKAAPATAVLGQSFTVDATAPGGAITYGSAGGCSNVGALFTMTSATLACTVKYDQTGSANYNAAPEITSQTTASKSSQTITVTAGKAAPVSAVFGTSFTVDASAPGGAVSYGSSGGCSNVGPVFTMTSGTDPCTVKYDQPGGDSYSAALEVTSQTAAVKADQAITVTAGKGAPASAQYGTSFTVTATAPAGTVTYSSSGGCSNAGTTFTMTSATTPCTVAYSQSGNSNYNAAPQVSSQTAAAKADQVITVTAGKGAPATALVGASFTVDATAPGGAVSYGSSGGCSNVGPVFTVTSATICTVKYDQAGSANYNAAPEVVSSTNSSKLEQSITITKAAPASAQFGTTFTVAATAPGGDVAYSSAGGCSNVGALYTMTSGSLACTVKYDQAGGSGYNAAPQITSQTAAAKGDQNITVTSPAPASATVGTTFTVAATAPGGTVTFGSAGGCSNNGATFTMTTANSDCTVKYDQAGSGDYAAAPEKTSTTTVVAAAPGAPGAPTAVSASAVSGQATVVFTAPGANGGSAIIDYTVTATPGSITVTGSGSPIVVRGLSNGTAYTFTVTARNSAGTGLPSAASAAVTPLPNGDLNGDGVVDIRDAQYALRLATGLETPTADLLVRGDVAPLVNGRPAGDGKMDVGDVIVLLRKVVGLVNW